jgi:hypothetical protein
MSSPNSRKLSSNSQSMKAIRTVPLLAPVSGLAGQPKVMKELLL